MSKFAKFQIFLITLLFVVSAFFGGYYFGKRGFEYQVKFNPPKVTVVNKSPADQKVDFALFWDIWDRVQTQYLERPVDSQKMLYGAIDGMVKSLGDPYTSFLPPQVNKAVNNSLDGKYEGIGAELGIKDNQLIVVAPLDGSPAKEAGILAGDRILEINNETTFGISITEAVSKIRGSAGTSVSMKLQHGEGDPFDVNLTRREITVASVTWEDKNDGTAYIRVSRFGSDTDNQWSKVASEVNVKMPQLDAIVIDVRGNPGGYLQSAVYIAGEFFRDKPVVYEETPMGEQIPLNANRNGVFTRIPAVFILIDGGSASASEILSAALKETIGAKLVGVKSFGKGTIQDTKDFSDGSGIHITIAKWLTPNKEWVHKKGIEPDVVVERTMDDVNNNRDPQLDKAVELAKKY